MKEGLTKKRKTVLDLIQQSEVPLNAKDISQSIGNGINLATVYRALSFLEAGSYVEGFTLPCSKEGTVRYFYDRAKPHIHFFHCINCHQFTVFNDCRLNASIADFQKKSGALVNDHVLYLTGLCTSCRGESGNGKLHVSGKIGEKS